VNVKSYWSYFEERLNHDMFSVDVSKMSYSLPTTFLLAIFLILGNAQYAKGWYKVLRKGKIVLGN